jgi:small subunit ribosomal protein S2
MNLKKYLYAAVGAPVTLAKGAMERMTEMRSKITTNAKAMRKDADKAIGEWAVEGEKVVEKITESAPIDELASRVDFDQMQEQVSKLRDQLEDLLGTWRTNFRPGGKVEVKTPIKVKVEEPVAEFVKPVTKPAAKKPAARKPAAKKPAARKPAAKKPAAKAS